ncbi:MAG: hypothetical protein WC121_01915 [Candidatus Kapaibacterium sp.]
MIKYTILLALLYTNLTAQSPFDDFKDDDKIINIHQLEDNTEFKIVNEDRNSLISYGVLRENKLYFYDKNENLVLLYTLDDKEDKFLSRDPKEKSFVGISPYTFGMNNPISYIDPGGDSTFSIGDEQDKYSTSIETKYPSLQVEPIPMDINNFVFYQKISLKPSYKGPVSDEAKLLIEASENKEINTYMFAMEGVKIFKWSNTDAERTYIAGGHYGKKETDKKGNAYGVSYLNYDAISTYISRGLARDGDVTTHETIELYLSMKDNLTQQEAHKKALTIVPNAETTSYSDYNSITKKDVQYVIVSGTGRKIILDRIGRNEGNTVHHDELIKYLGK